MRNKILNILKVSSFLIFGVFLSYLSLKDVHFDDLKSKTDSINYFYVFISVALGGLSHLVRAIRWKFLLEPLGYKPSLLNLTGTIYVSYFVNLAIPRLGEIVRSTLLYKTDKVPVEKSFGTIISDRLVDMLCLAGFASFTLYLEYKVISNYFFQSIFNPLMIKLSPLLQLEYYWLFLILLLTAISWVLFKLFRRIEGKTRDLFLGFKNGVFSIFKVKNPIKFGFLSILMWVMYFSQVFFMFKAFEATELLSYNVALVVFVFGGLAMIVTPGGIGAYPLVVSDILQVYGLSSMSGIFIGWFLWLIQTIFLIIGGIIFLILLSVQKK